ncbi:MAG TPA: nicotinamide-nucleotide amidohydrolase family protein [Phycisphaerae bacterium]|nr:nicotinamide-nucleotide amidohydrolase family protein [Phycisphaerae bacterium]
MRAVILSIGSELVTGLAMDTHSAEIARALGSLGVAVVRHETLDDDVAEIAVGFVAAAGDADLVIATGGLGPTSDDLTRDGLAQAIGVPLETNPEALAMLEALPNPMGTAPGILARLDKARVFCLPGVPVEMRRMLEDQVLPRIKEPGAGRVARVRTVRTFGSPESVVGERLADLMAPGRRPRVATAVHSGVIDVHIHASGSADEVDRLLEADAAEVKRRLEAVVFGEGADGMEDAVAAILAQRGATLAVAESCTGGLVAARLVDVPGMSEHLVEGIVAYSNASKVRLLGVPKEIIEQHGAVSEPVVRAMAEGVRAASGADVGVAVTGIAGPSGGTPDKPVGTAWFAVTDGAGTHAARELFVGDRATIRARAAVYALNLVRLRLSGGREQDPL